MCHSRLVSPVEVGKICVGKLTNISSGICSSSCAGRHSREGTDVRQLVLFDFACRSYGSIGLHGSRRRKGKGVTADNLKLPAVRQKHRATLLLVLEPNIAKSVLHLHILQTNHVFEIYDDQSLYGSGKRRILSGTLFATDSLHSAHFRDIPGNGAMRL